MGFEPPKPNDFRAFLKAGPGASPVVATKTARVDESADGLKKVAVPRSEARRSNQREVDRHRLSFEEAVIRCDAERHVVELVNLSGGGAMIRGDIKARLWDRVELVLGDTGALECAVCWIRGDQIGLEFAHETQIDCDRDTRDQLLRDVISRSFPGTDARSSAAATSADDRREGVRHPLIWNGLVHHDHESNVVRLRNISASGALIECAGLFPEGAQVLFDLGDAGSVAATVEWTRGDQAGLAFAEQFDLAGLANICPDLAPEESADAQTQDPEAETHWAARWGRLSLDQLSHKLFR